MTLKASIDIGSNSTLLLVIDSISRNVIEEISTITSLGKDLDKNQVFLKQSMNDTFEALKYYAQVCSNNGIGVDDIIVTATEASRVAKNASDFYHKVKSELGLTVTLITGEGEAFYTALGISLMHPNIRSGLIMDIGGASTELIKFCTQPFTIESSISLPIGSVRVTDWSREGVLELRVQESIGSKDLNIYNDQDVICVAGTMTSISLMMQNEESFKREKIESYTSNLVDFEKFVAQLKNRSEDDLDSTFNYLGKRKLTIKGGAQGALEILKLIKARTLYFSTYGLRYGAALSGGINESYCV